MIDKLKVQEKVLEIKIQDFNICLNISHVDTDANLDTDSDYGI